MSDSSPPKVERAANPAIPRDQVHEIAEACADAGEAFRPVALRLVRTQRRLTRFFNDNLEPMGMMPGQVALHMLTVTLHIFDQVGGRVDKVAGREIEAAAARVQAAAEQLMPADEDFPKRARAVEWRAQPHLLDEVLWALYEREDDEEQPDEDGGQASIKLKPDEKAMIYLLMWAAIEALDDNWHPPSGFGKA